MRVGLLSLLVSSIAVLSSTFTPVSALTNGTLIPAYMCGPPTDGLPKSLGGVLPFFKLATNPGPASQVMDGVVKVPGRPLDAPLGSTMNTQLLVAGFHSSQVQTTTIVPVVNVIQLALKQVMAQGSTTALAGITSVAPGLDHAFSVQSFPNGAFDVNTALDGGIVYAQDANAVRIGQFVNTGPNMQIWAACGPLNVGVVHNQLLSCTGEYPAAVTDAAGNTAPAPVTAGLIWRAPANLVPGQVITFKGAGVTDLGFGPWSTQFTVVAAPATTPAIPCITTVNNQNAGASLVFFSADAAAGSCKFTMNIVDVTQANRAVVTNQAVAASPAVYKISALMAAAKVAAGDTLAITITATNAQGASTSTPVNVVVGTQAAVQGTCVPVASAPAAKTAAAAAAAAAAKTATAAAAAAAAAAPTATAKANSASLVAQLCNPVAVAEAAKFGMDHDSDNACSYAAALDSHIGAAAAASGVTGFLEMDAHGRFVPPAEEFANKQTDFQAKSFAIGLVTALGTIGVMGAAAYAVTNKNKRDGYSQPR